DSIKLVCEIFERQSLKGMPFKTFNAATDEDIKEFWKKINLINDTIVNNDYEMKNLKQLVIGEDTCSICLPFRCPREIFTQLYNLPDLIPGVDSHYKSFKDLYGTQISEKYRPSHEKPILKTKSIQTRGSMKGKTKHIMPFCSSALRAKNVRIIVSCTECDKPRLLFSAKKLLETDRQILSRFLDTILCTCRTAFHDTCELSFATPSRQHYESDEIPEHEYNYENDSVPGSSNSNQELNIYNIDDKSDDNMRSDESSKSVRNDTCPNNPEEDTEDVISDPIQKIFKNVFVNDSWTCNSPVEKPYYLASIYSEVCYLCGSLNINQSTLLDTTRPLHSKKNLP
ncbi:25695_t:CDS:2, partial [Gigaspora margarita]